MTKPEHYKALDGIRGIVAICIILMHVEANTAYELSGFVADKLIPSFTNFTYFFMIISAFSLCCGYFEKFQNGTTSLEQFYIRRYKRIWPFFAFLCTIDFILEPSLRTWYQYLADITLAFGLIPNNRIEVIGVGWFLGTVFVFYMIFPFFCFLLRTKQRAWLAYFVTVMLHTLSDIYFKAAQDRTNFVYSAMFFMAGGLIYLYRDRLHTVMQNKSRWGIYFLLAISVITYYSFISSDYLSLIIFSIMCICCLRTDEGGIFQSTPCLWLGKISMEIYLCHMVTFRVIEKLNLLTLVENRWACYLLVSAMTIIGAIIMSVIFRKTLMTFRKKLSA